MASVVKLISPIGGLNFYYNVSAKVGPYASLGCTNNPADVELVNLLLSLGFPSNDWPSKMKQGPVPRGPTLDPVSCFLIYVTQDSADESNRFSNNSRPDGVISVGNSSGGYGQGTAFTILSLNGKAKKNSPAAWQRLWEQPGVSPMLKAQITHSYS